MTPDPRLVAALAEALHDTILCLDEAHLWPACEVQDWWIKKAAAILGERGVFLSDGQVGLDNLGYQQGLRHGAAEIATLRADLAHCERSWEDAGKEIATLRAALELVVAQKWWRNWGAGQSVALDAARAALATAKEATDG